jgi:RpiR family transcriptional regulator, carbohydrate utilization regulator
MALIEENNRPQMEAMNNILEFIRLTRSEMRKSDRKVADLVLANPREILNSTIAEAAELAHVSQPTIMRFCVKIGCTGYQDFKLKLAESLALGMPATHSVLLNTDPSATIISKIFDYTITSLAWARQHLQMDAIDKAVDLLQNAKAIEFFGFGASAIVARDAQQKFPLFGVPCGAQLDSHQQVMTASMMRPGQVAVVISNTGRTKTIIEIARITRESGASVIGITGADSALMEYCDVTLLVETLDNTNIYTPTISRIAALVLIDVLSTAVALRQDELHMEKFKRMKQRLNNLRYNETI